MHCTEGKDRTGFICMLLEALAGAAADYLRSGGMTDAQITELLARLTG